MTRRPGHLLRRCAAGALFLLGLAAPAAAGVGAWTSSGPFATGAGNQVVDALAFDPAGILFAGTASGTVFTYTATTGPSGNADLAGLALSAASLAPAFAPATVAYAATVASDVASVTLTATAADAAASITVDGIAVASGAASGPIPLQAGGNTFTTVVTAPDGVSRKTYAVTVFRGALASQTTLFSGSNPATLGQTIVLTATVAGTAPTGQVIFSAAGTPLAACGAGAGVALAGGRARCSLDTLTAGSHELAAAYSGDAGNPASAGSLTQFVYAATRLATTTHITGTTAGLAVVGRPVRVSYLVSAADGAPGGLVTVSDGEGASCTAGVAAGGCELAFTSPGEHTLVAIYGGDADHASSRDSRGQAVTGPAPVPTASGLAMAWLALLLGLSGAVGLAGRARC